MKGTNLEKFHCYDVDISSKTTCSRTDKFFLFYKISREWESTKAWYSFRLLYAMKRSETICIRRQTQHKRYYTSLMNTCFTRYWHVNIENLIEI